MKLAPEVILLVAGFVMLVVAGSLMTGPSFTGPVFTFIGEFTLALWLPTILLGVLIRMVRLSKQEPRWLVAVLHICAFLNLPVLFFLSFAVTPIVGAIAAIAFVWLASRVQVGTPGSVKLFAGSCIVSSAVELVLLTQYPNLRGDVRLALLLFAIALGALGAYMLKTGKPMPKVESIDA